MRHTAGRWHLDAQVAWSCDRRINLSKLLSKHTLLNKVHLGLSGEWEIVKFQQGDIKIIIVFPDNLSSSHSPNNKIGWIKKFQIHTYKQKTYREKREIAFLILSCITAFSSAMNTHRWGAWVWLFSGNITTWRIYTCWRTSYQPLNHKFPPCQQ